MIRKMRPAASLRGRETGRMIPSCVGAGGGASRLVHAPAVDQRERGDVLLDAVFENLEVVFRQIGDELVLGVADDDVHVDQVDVDREIGLLTLRRRGGGLRRRDLSSGCLSDGECARG